MVQEFYAFHFKDAHDCLYLVEAAHQAGSAALLKLKARVGQRSDDIGVDWPDNLGAGLERDILAFVETVPIGRPDFTNPDALTTAVLNGWAEWAATPYESDGRTEATKAWQRIDAERDRLLYAAMALPATPENIVPKALACAWMEWVCTERPGQPRDAYGPADQLVYDLHATIMKGRPSASASRPGTSYSYLANGIDFASASMKDLLTIRDIAQCIGDITAAYAWGGRCRHRLNAYGAPEYNAASRMVTSLSDALTAVESAAEREAKRRTPDDDWGQNIRLFMLSPTVIDNDDPDEIEALGREILAHAEALRSQG